MAKIAGYNSSLVLLVEGENAVVVDTSKNLVVDSGTKEALASKKNWKKSKSCEVTPAMLEIADAALSSLDVSVITAAAGRLYTVPSSVQAEAKKALEWRKEHKRGGTPVGLSTARTLAKGGQIGLQKVRHIAKYFPRHEVDKKAKGYERGEDGFPSNGRIAWALWGGDAGWRWAKNIVERENKKALTSDGYALPGYSIDDDTYAISEPGYGADLNAFGDAHALDDGGPEFMARVRMDGSGMDRLYKVDVDGRVYFWDDGGWDDLGSIDGDIYFYDKSLDDPYDDCDKSHFIIDPDSALIISALLQQDPYTNVSVDDIDSHEASLARNAIAEEDWGMVDRVARASDEDPYYPMMAAAAMPVDKEAEKEEAPAPAVDTKGILGEPHKEDNAPAAKIDSELPALTAKDLGLILNDWPGWVMDQRKTTTEQGLVAQRTTTSDDYSVSDSVDTDKSYEHPLLKPWLDKKAAGISTKSTDNPALLSAAEPVSAKPTTVKDIEEAAKETKPGSEVTPGKTDVQPMYLAFVSPDDPHAVFDLIALVPASSTSNQPMTYRRQDKKWVRYPSALQDLKSATPPPVVPLDKEALDATLKQIDGMYEALNASVFSVDHQLMVLWGPSAVRMEDALVAAGGVDKNRGNAERLRRYWSHGKGAAKIRWGTKGDWSRCVRHLSKFLGVRAKGYCQLRHKEATGMYTATHAKLDRAKHNSNSEFIMEEVYAKNTGVPTAVTEQDMAKKLTEIMVEHDDVYDHHWKPEPQIVDDLKRLNLLDDEEFEAIVAAGGFDRNRGNAEELRRYWTVGKGAKKIRWGTGGDWTRCVRQLSKYLGPRAKGYCQLRHKEVTGEYTGDRAHMEKYGHLKKKTWRDRLKLFSIEEKVIELAERDALAAGLRERMGLTASAVETGAGSAFRIPLAIPEDVESGDGRLFKKDSITVRELPIPLLWQLKTGEGHSGSVVVGRVDRLERVENGIGNAYGVFDDGKHGKEAERLVRAGFLRGVSADMDQFEAKQTKSKKKDAAEDDDISAEKIVINKARVMAITIVPKPAFQECKILIDSDELENPQEEIMILNDGIYVDDVDASDAAALVACGAVAGSIPVVPPANWFVNPKLSKPTPLTVDDSGRVFGHIAAWHVDHIGLTAGTKPPRSRSNYAYFHSGVVRADNGKDVPVGQLTLAGGHASIEASAYDAVKHYDDTASAVADVHAGEDEFGIWVAGALRPSAQPEQIRALRASAPSGDWRPIKGSLELVAVCQVNVPGFPIARARVASGQVMALVAAGAAVLAKLKQDPMTELASRVRELEQFTGKELATNAASAKARFASIVDEMPSKKPVTASVDSMRAKIAAAQEALGK